ncbi:unnamed protein product, partial [Brassica oleracea var. botrytis]
KEREGERESNRETELSVSSNNKCEGRRRKTSSLYSKNRKPQKEMIATPLSIRRYRFAF